MPEQNIICSQTFTNNETSSTISKYRVAILDTASEGGVKLPSGASSVEKIAGVADADVEAGKTGNFVFSGIAYCDANAAISLGDVVVIAATTGRIMSKAAGATAQGLAIVGVALRAAGAQGDIIPVFLQIHNEYAS